MLSEIVARAPLNQIAEYLESLPHLQRVGAARGLGRGPQRTLYEKASNEIALSHIVPADVPARAQVVHHGRNTLPAPWAFGLFEKRFCRPQDGSSRLFGYNEAPLRWYIGPGYFVASSTESEARWRSRGGVVVDYFRVPDGPVAYGWPQVIPNERGLQRFVFGGTRDFLRRVSEHVSVGAAYRGEKSLDQYFVLVREPT